MGLFGLFKPDVAEMKRRRDVNGLIKTLQYEKKSNSASVQLIRTKAAMALGEIGDVKAVEPLIEVFDNENSNFQLVVIDALRKIGDSRAIDPLVRTTKHKDSTLRTAAIKALFELGGPKAVESLVQALEDDDIHIRNYAVDALAKMGDARALEPLIQALNNHYDAVGYAITQLLDRLGWNRINEGAKTDNLIVKEGSDKSFQSEEPAVIFLLRALKTVKKDEQDLMPMVVALGEIGDARAIEPLEHAWNLAQTPDLREKIEMALEKIMAKKSQIG